jgi:hypothetical protein
VTRCSNTVGQYSFGGVKYGVVCARDSVGVESIIPTNNGSAKTLSRPTPFAG